MMKINFPKGYYWLLERNLISYETFGALQPWLYLPKEHQFNLNDKWGTTDCFNRISLQARFKINESNFQYIEYANINNYFFNIIIPCIYLCIYSIYYKG